MLPWKYQLKWSSNSTQTHPTSHQKKYVNIECSLCKHPCLAPKTDLWWQEWLGLEYTFHTSTKPQQLTNPPSLPPYSFILRKNEASLTRHQQHRHQRSSTSRWTVSDQYVPEAPRFILLSPQCQGQPWSQDACEDGMKNPRWNRVPLTRVGGRNVKAISSFR